MTSTPETFYGAVFWKKDTTSWEAYGDFHADRDTGEEDYRDAKENLDARLWEIDMLSGMLRNVRDITDEIDAKIASEEALDSETGWEDDHIRVESALLRLDVTGGIVL